ncbi:hypothetical protein [Amycolatopsis nigrescens]|uniref:hypothetical protein n=1 Tax=Amycolatopsis nigrescens TaxID=381445 RepID=UPI0003747006|nr:hypothetical protein [Amycolatopsis nigrescens]
MATSLVYRITGVFGVLSAFVLIVNAFRRLEVISPSGLVRGLSPLAEAFGLLLLVGVYLRHAPRIGRLGLAGFALNAIGLAGVAGIEYILNFVYSVLPRAQVAALQDGSAGTAIVVTSMVFLAGVVLFGLSLVRSDAPNAAVALYVLGCGLIALRGVLPEAGLQVGLLAAAAGSAWLGLSLFREAGRTAADRSRVLPA